MYVRAKTGTLDAPVVLAEALVEQRARRAPSVRILERFRGAAIDGVRYEPPFSYLPAAAFGERGHTVLLAGFVTATEGTGLVERRAGVRRGRPAPRPPATGSRSSTRSAADGAFDERAGRYAGRQRRDAEPVALDDLRARGRLLRAESTHERAAPRVRRLRDAAAAVREVVVVRRVVARSAAMRDRAALHERVWGTPLPVWRCEHGHVTVVGSFDELEQRSGSRLEDPHRPHADDVALACDVRRARRRASRTSSRRGSRPAAMPFAAAPRAVRRRADARRALPRRHRLRAARPGRARGRRRCAACRRCCAAANRSSTTSCAIRRAVGRANGATPGRGAERRRAALARPHRRAGRAASSSRAC